MMVKRLILLSLVVLSGCATSSDRLAMIPLDSNMNLTPLVDSVMVKRVSLPTYAAVEEVAFERTEGLIASNPVVLWADDPQRAVTLALTRNLSDILNNQVGPEPWPLAGLPAVSIDVRVERMLAGIDGHFHLAGQVYIAGEGIDFPNASQQFDIAAPLVDQSLANIANAQAQALLSLSELIAQKLGR